MASEYNSQYNSILASESSLPGTGYTMSRGSQLVSTTPVVMMFILEHSTTALCCLKTLSWVEKKMQRSGIRVMLPYIISALVKVPRFHSLQCEYSPQSCAIVSTKGRLWRCLDRNRMTPCLYATLAVMFRESRSSSTVCSKSMMSIPRRVP